jgi:hypothetical protein
MATDTARLHEGLSQLFDEESSSAAATALALSRLPRSRTDLACAAFWRQRYASDAATLYDWYHVSLSEAIEVADLSKLLLPHTLCLHLGCGTSSWGAQLTEDYGVHVLDSDIDKVLLARLEREGGKPSFTALDATALAVRSQLFDVVLEKGVLDALNCGGSALVFAAASEALRVGSVLISVTANASLLLPTLETLPNAQIQVFCLGAGGGSIIRIEHGS